MNVVLSPTAEEDLSNLFTYIRDDLQNPIAAHNIVEKILRISNDLVRFPQMGASLRNVDKRISNYRHLIAGNYLIIYRIEGQEVLIVRILYARSNYIRLLQG